MIQPFEVIITCDNKNISCSNSLTINLIMNYRSNIYGSLDEEINAAHFADALKNEILSSGWARIEKNVHLCENCKND